MLMRKCKQMISAETRLKLSTKPMAKFASPEQLSFFHPREGDLQLC